ncbi:uncharacterized protein G2W53_026560 [Senna tora]|uniref:Uncharacterized protein n=1 Tax=Senna tora TaxID=362788 RepID=A0A834WF73_9FABA|nr:uncharacterized protein G2W53_026560 [Senna tora]
MRDPGLTDVFDHSGAITINFDAKTICVAIRITCFHIRLGDQFVYITCFLIGFSDPSFFSDFENAFFSLPYFLLLFLEFLSAMYVARSMLCLWF